MKRFLIMTVGKTHSGKTTFAEDLERKLPDSVVVDQDRHAEFLAAYYPRLLPTDGPNLIKYRLAETIIEYALHESAQHLIMANANLNPENRRKLLRYHSNNGLESILVHFDIADSILEKRIAKSKRNLNILRTASTFSEVLKRQQRDADEAGSKEADHYFVIKNPAEVPRIVRSIVRLINQK
ncbi:Predicted kinase [Halobacillus dabanensis]|uniref:Predicted kinase n=1 Tax=Halobacillus dabanensis TaxID=240302 RepID=A0A1I3TFM3_HALDA|nr:AAA family ATPase [Halobacillus dabanensis]SFJ69259.1 Predicted kinase [Halobacillus dabanensis]